MSWWHLNYHNDVLNDLVRWLNVYIWYDQPKDYKWLNEKYYKSLEKRMKVPKWVKLILKEYIEILHNIDYDVSWDATIKKWYFDKKKKKILWILK